MNGDIDYLKRELDRLRAQVIPQIGDIYITTNSLNPADRFGGEWAAWGAGRVPVGIDSSDTDFDTIGETGGSKTHTLTAAQIPNLGVEINRYDSLGLTNRAYASGGAGQGVTASGSPGSPRLYGTTSNTGGQSHPIVQPYVVCYMWKRIG